MEIRGCSVVVVTGAASGIGEAMVERFTASEGAGARRRSWTLIHRRSEQPSQNGCRTVAHACEAITCDVALTKKL